MRFLPSEIVRIIDEWFPWAKSNTVSHLVLQLNSPAVFTKVLTVASMLEGLPDELVRLDSTEAAEFAYAVSAIQYALDLYRRQLLASPRDQGLIRWATVDPDQVFDGRSPMAIVRQHLEKCPDEIPARGTADLPFFSDRGIRETLALEISDVGHAIAGREWRAATILGGAALEGVLYWSLSALSNEINSLPSKPSKPLEDWELSKMIDTARNLNLIEEHTKKLAHLARDARNLVHPAAVKTSRRNCDKATSQTVAAAIDAVVRDIRQYCLRTKRDL